MRGRPRGPGRKRLEADIDLIGFVRDRKAGVTVEAALREYRRLRGAQVGAVWPTLMDRYRKATKKYPGEWH